MLTKIYVLQLQGCWETVGDVRIQLGETKIFIADEWIPKWWELERFLNLHKIWIAQIIIVSSIRVVASCKDPNLLV